MLARQYSSKASPEGRHRTVVDTVQVTYQAINDMRSSLLNFACVKNIQVLSKRRKTLSAQTEHLER